MSASSVNPGLFFYYSLSEKIELLSVLFVFLIGTTIDI